ncbi:2-succinyl-6-hydroxy-2,4-cyclohexadiene-1-carboxylate synthase [Neobacillus sp. SM06]|uniref:2-succinyl-6-hydroxy-2, 4-cyclohexadiene-1-carboxylate synthase n=1 Tax=Neobacillus sp. SM06 TaxID=3422492 RepID=UPI003D2E78B0
MEYFIDDVRYYVETCGEGYPLLLLHGFTGDSSTWLPFCSKWGRHSRLIIPDLIGHGKTESLQDLKRYAIESAANDLRLLLDEIGVDQVDLLGYSMGGRLGLTFSLLFPERVRKLILESSSPGLLTEEDRSQRRKQDQKLALTILEKGIGDFVDYWENIPLFSTVKEAPGDVKEAIRQQRLSQNPDGLANSLLGMGTGSQPSWWDKLHLIENETLLVTGEKDKKFCRIAEKMSAELKKSRWAMIKNSGHAIHVEEPEKFGTIVSGFLTQLM